MIFVFVEEIFGQPKESLCVYDSSLVVKSLIPKPRLRIRNFSGPGFANAPNDNRETSCYNENPGCRISFCPVGDRSNRPDTNSSDERITYGVVLMLEI